MKINIYPAGNVASRSAERMFNCSHYVKCSRIRLCSMTENLELPYNDHLQPVAIEFWECLLLAESTTISKLLHEKRSNSEHFDTEDTVAWDRRAPKDKEYFFPEERGVYLDELVVIAAGEEGHFLDLKAEAHEVLKLTQTQQWQGFHTWLDWIGGDGIKLHRGTRENILKVGIFLGAGVEYLEDLMGHGQHGQEVQPMEKSYQEHATDKAQQTQQPGATTEVGPEKVQISPLVVIYTQGALHSVALSSHSSTNGGRDISNHNTQPGAARERINTQVSAGSNHLLADFNPFAPTINSTLGPRSNFGGHPRLESQSESLLPTPSQTVEAFSGHDTDIRSRTSDSLPEAERAVNLMHDKSEDGALQPATRPNEVRSQHMLVDQPSSKMLKAESAPRDQKRCMQHLRADEVYLDGIEDQAGKLLGQRRGAVFVDSALKGPRHLTKEGSLNSGFPEGSERNVDSNIEYPENIVQETEAEISVLGNKKLNVLGRPKQTRVRRVRIYITDDVPDIPFDDPRQPLYLELPEDLLCRHSSRIRDAIQKKRSQGANFDPLDEIIWDPKTSTAPKNFRPPYPVIYLEALIISFCAPPGKKKPSNESPPREERALEKGEEKTKGFAHTVKRLQSRNVGELWDALKTWIFWIQDQGVVLFEAEKAKENALDVGDFLGATALYLQELEEYEGVEVA